MSRRLLSTRSHLICTNAPTKAATVPTEPTQVARSPSRSPSTFTLDPLALESVDNEDCCSSVSDHHRTRVKTPPAYECLNRVHSSGKPRPRCSYISSTPSRGMTPHRSAHDW